MNMLLLFLNKRILMLVIKKNKYSCLLNVKYFLMVEVNKILIKILIIYL